MTTGMWDEIEDIISNERIDRQMSSIDESATAALWARLEPRYAVQVIIDGMKDRRWHRRVIRTHYLFHTEMPSSESNRFLVLAPNRTLEDACYPRILVEETFSKKEVREIHRYFAHFANVRVKANVAGPPVNNLVGFPAMAVGGHNDFWMFDKADDYSIPFKVYGYFDRYEDVECQPEVTTA